jgi:type II secretory pathway pseudopilin PulG
VVAILAILAGLLLPAVFAVRRHARKVAAQTEVQTMETAWRRYYSEYQKWPTNTKEVETYPITGNWAVVLLGTPAGADNPKGLTFMPFRRLDAEGNPVNPWWNPGTPSTGCYFYARFDTDHDRIIRADATGDEPDTDVSRQVIVWTRNPNEPPGEPDGAVRSWQP